MSSAPEIIVLGSINTDLVIRGPRLPRPGETVLGGAFFQAAGGKGANQAVAAARLARQPVALIAAVGDDELGTKALDGFARENLLTTHIRRFPGAASGVALIMVDERGENAISVASGANALLTPADVAAVPDEIFARAKVFLTCLESPLETVECGLRRAKAAGLITILNPAPADVRACRPDLFRLVDLLTPNESEAEALSGKPVTSVGSAMLAGEYLQSLGCKKVIVTRGAARCVVVEILPAEETLAVAKQDQAAKAAASLDLKGLKYLGNAVTVPSLAIDAVDTTAAGDAFNGALAVALAEGQHLLHAILFARRCAAISVTRQGAQPSLPWRQEVEERIQEEGRKMKEEG